MRVRFGLAAAAALVFAGGSAVAQERTPERAAAPTAFQRAVQCRTVADPQERLACYDREVAALAEAEQRSEIRVVDRQEIRRTRRSLFGIQLPDLSGIFGGGGDGEDAVNEIQSNIRSASQNALGKWVLVLEDGARWQQIDSRELVSDPRAGQPVRIRRAAMGSYLANVNGQIAIRVRRVQ